MRANLYLYDGSEIEWVFLALRLVFVYRPDLNYLDSEGLGAVLGAAPPCH